jgi:hypothetical protein
VKRFAAIIVMLDGIISALWGLGFLRWLEPRLPKLIHPVLDIFFMLPESLFRLGAVAQAIVGWLMLRRTSTS